VSDLGGGFRDDGFDAAPAAAVPGSPATSLPCRPITASGRVLARPPLRRGTRPAAMTAGNMGESPPWPGPRIITSGRPLPSEAWWVLVLSPRRKRPMA
jgi:hypothetical protein